MLLLDAIEEAGGERARVIDALFRTKVRKGILGSFGFEPEHLGRLAGAVRGTSPDGVAEDTCGQTYCPAQEVARTRRMAVVPSAEPRVGAPSVARAGRISRRARPGGVDQNGVRVVGSQSLRRALTG